MLTAPVVVDSNQSLASNYNSPAISMDQQWGTNIQAIWTGSPVGTLKLQTSLDYQPGGPTGHLPPNAGTWNDYPNSSGSSSGVNSFSWDVTATGAKWFRVAFVSTSGTGTLTSLLAETKGV